MPPQFSSGRQGFEPPRGPPFPQRPPLRPVVNPSPAFNPEASAPSAAPIQPPAAQPLTETGPEVSANVEAPQSAPPPGIPIRPPANVQPSLAPSQPPTSEPVGPHTIPGGEMPQQQFSPNVGPNSVLDSRPRFPPAAPPLRNPAPGLRSGPLPRPFSAPGRDFSRGPIAGAGPLGRGVLPNRPAGFGGSSVSAGHNPEDADNRGIFEQPIIAQLEQIIQFIQNPETRSQAADIFRAQRPDIAQIIEQDPDRAVQILRENIQRMGPAESVQERFALTNEEYEIVKRVSLQYIFSSRILASANKKLIRLAGPASGMKS